MDGGLVRHGLVYRSTDLNGLTDAGMGQLAALGLHTIYDLRTTAERTAQPDRVPSGVTDVQLDVLADDPANAAAGAGDLQALLSDPAKVAAVLATTSLTSMFTTAYQQIVSLPSALAAYHSMYSGIADASRRPVLFHCTTGKDRTGWGSAALLSFLGVSRDQVIDEYMLTNVEILPFTQPLYDEFQAAGGDPDLLRPALGVEKSYLNTAFEVMESEFGTVEDYFTKGLKLDDSTLDSLRSALIEPVSAKS